jgi:antitoxin HicB
MATTNDTEARVRELLERQYRMEVRGDPEEGYLATAPELPGCMTAGETPVEAMELLRDAMAAWFASAIEHGDAIPKPAEASKESYSGRLLLRMPKTLHRDLAEGAEREGVSLNQYVVALLSAQIHLAARQNVFERAQDAKEVQMATITTALDQAIKATAAGGLTSAIDRVLADTAATRITSAVEHAVEAIQRDQDERIRQIVDEPFNRLQAQIQGVLDASVAGLQKKMDQQRHQIQEQINRLARIDRPA